ncbi:MAG: glutamate decarboxylase, partial [Minicystis sp.]
MSTTAQALSTDAVHHGSLPSGALPERGMSAKDTYESIHAELLEDDHAGSNLGSFVTPRMDPWAEKLIVENLGKNFVCGSEYRQSKIIHDRMVEALAHLYNAPKAPRYTGAATAGSSEAIQLALLAHKFSWRNRRAAEGKPGDRPNLVVFSDAHVCWDKFARFFDVELRKVPLQRIGAGYEYSIDAVRDRIDENTICVGAVVGTTYTGACHPVAAINALLEQIEAERGWDIPIHVDAATGGFLLPFLPTGAQIEWDFRLSHVRSINVSGHKYGLVYPGIGWLLFRDSTCLPRELVFDAPYLGSPLDTFTLNFSRSAAPIVAQYFNFVRYGREGFRALAARCGELARQLAGQLSKGSELELISDLELPIVCFRPKAGSEVDAFELSRLLRTRGWVVPAYTMPEGGEGDTVLRVVVHERFDEGMVSELGRAIEAVCKELCAERGLAPVRPTLDVTGEAAFLRDARAALRGLPSFLAYGHIGLLGIIDCLMVGPLGVTPLAAVGFAANVLAPFYILVTGIAFALPPIIAREATSHRVGGASARLRECLSIQALFAGVSIAVLLLLSQHLGIFRQPLEVTRAARPYFLGMTLALIPLFVFAALREYAISLGRPLVPAAFAATAIAIKVLLGAALIHGFAGAPPLGAFGASVATSVGYGAAALLFALHLSRGGLLPWSLSAEPISRKRPLLDNAILAQGLPVSLQQLFEMGAFYFAGIMTGWLGASALAGHHIGLSIVNGAALLSLSISQSTSAQVSQHVGERGGALLR